MMKKYDLVFTIGCLSESIANSVRIDLEKELKRIYRDIIVKSKTIEHPTFEGVLNLQKEMKEDFEDNFSQSESDLREEEEYYFGCRRRYNTRYLTTTQHWYKLAQYLKGCI